MLRRDKYNLTIPQENIWMLEKLNSNTNMNNILGMFKIDKQLNIEILQKVMNKIIETNDALRIRITEENNIPLQSITDFEYENFMVYLLDADNEHEVNKIINKIAEEKLKILNEKLYDIRLIQNKTSTYVCVKTHHIISDAWTLGQVAEQIKDNYIKISNNEEVLVKPSYLEYIKKDEKYRVSEKYMIDKEYWDTYIKELECENEFIISKDKKSKRIEKQISLELYEEIHDFCEINKITEYSFFLAVISIYFSKIFNRENFVIGTPFLNRKKTDKELDVMGMFISTLPININLKNDSNFIEVCKNINSTNRRCFKHSSYPYSEIQKSYQNFSKINTNLYEVAFSYQINKLEVEIDGDTGKTTWISNNTQANPVLISYVNHFGEHIFYYDYLLECISKNNIDEIHQRIIYIINQVIKNAFINIETIDIVSKKDLDLITEFNKSGIMDNELIDNIVSRFNSVALKEKQNTAVVCGENKISYKELDEKSSVLCENILKKEVKSNSPVAIIIDNSIEFIISILGVLKSGNYYIPVLPEEESERMKYIIKDSKAKIVITNNKYYNLLESKEVSKINIDILDFNIKNRLKNININSSDVSYLIYTSGTTGKPKGVMMKHENIISLIESMNLDEDLKYLDGDVSISLLKHSFDASAIDIYSSLLNGGKLVIVPKEQELNPKEVVNIIKKNNVTRVFTVHKWIDQIQKVTLEEKMKLKKLRIIGTGAEVLKPQKFANLLQENPQLRIYNTYGPTEATMFMTKHKITSKDIINNVSPIGKLMPGTRAVVVNKNNQILPINVKGELVIYEEIGSSKNISKGYYNLLELTQSKFIKLKDPINKQLCNAYKTGDIVNINSNLELEFFGRDDDFIKVSGGYLVSLNEVEQKIKKILGEDIEVSVVAISIKNSKSIILYISKNEKSNNIKSEEMKNLIDENITFYMKPKAIIELNGIPRNKNGKVDKKKLERMAIEYLKNKKENIQPRTSIEQMIYDEVKKITNCDFSITDDFEEDLGLDSLNITNLFMKLENEKMAIQDLYNYSTVQDLANMMKSEMLDDTSKNIKLTIKNNAESMELETILLTGATGFVGVNLLKELAENKNVEKIYCIVRSKLNLSSEQRFKDIVNTYFNETIYKKVMKKVVILDGDLNSENLGLDSEVYLKIVNEVRTIINCAANVKHIGKYIRFYNDNVKTVINLIDICNKYNIKLAHISTLSLNGFKNKNTHQIFDENVLSINQTFDKNPYLISKFEAEQKIIEAVNDGKLDAKIFRIGNIMPRISDGVFQKNYDQNAFMLAIKEVNNLEVDVSEIFDLDIYLTPVDECVKAINTVLNSKSKNIIYHIESDKEVKVIDIVKLVRKKAHKLNEVSDYTNHYNVGVEHLKSIISQDTNIYKKDITINLLKSLNFEWRSLDEKYLKNIVNIAFKI